MNDVGSQLHLLALAPPGSQLHLLALAPPGSQLHLLALHRHTLPAATMPTGPLDHAVSDVTPPSEPESMTRSGTRTSRTPLTQTEAEYEA